MKLIIISLRLVAVSSHQNYYYLLFIIKLLFNTEVYYYFISIIIIYIIIYLFMLEPFFFQFEAFTFEKFILTMAAPQSDDSRCCDSFRERSFNCLAVFRYVETLENVLKTSPLLGAYAGLCWTSSSGRGSCYASGTIIIYRGEN